MDLDWLNDFIALAEHGNFSRAADARHVTQPAFSRRVRALEDWLGTPLFERSAQGATLTPAGTAFQPLAYDLLQNLDRARRTARAKAEQATSTLRIAATHALSFSFFPSWLSKHVDLETFSTISLDSDSMDACEHAMLAGEAHFLLCHYRPGMAFNLPPENFPSVIVGHDALVPVSAPDGDGHPLWPVTGTSEGPSRVLAYSPVSGLGRILASASQLPSTLAKQTTFTSHLAATLLAMAKGGRGVAWLPQSIAAHDLAQGSLVRAGSTDVTIPIDIRLFRSPDCRNRASVALWRAIGGTSE